MALGEYRKFYRDINNGVIYQYIADACRIETRELVAICAAMNRTPTGQPAMVQIVGLAFRNYMVAADPTEVENVLKDIARKTAQKQQQQSLRMQP